jgi:hypothetical protein
MWFNKKRKLNEERLSQFRAGDEITYELLGSVITRTVVNNDPETKSLSVKYFNVNDNDSGKIPLSYSDQRFKNIRALNADPTDDTDLKLFLNDIIESVGVRITEFQKKQAKDLLKSYKL